MKRCFLIFCIFFNQIVYAADWLDCGPDVWNRNVCQYKIENGTLTIKATNNSSTTGIWNSSQSTNTAPWYSSRNEITNIIIDGSIDTIDGRAFGGMNKVTNVTMPNVKEISFL